MESEEKRHLPGDRLVVFLLNQSATMEAVLEDYGLNLGEAATDSVNLFLQKHYQVRETMPGAYAGDEFGVAVIGYGDDSRARRIFYMDSAGTTVDEDRTRRDTESISSDQTHPVFPIWIKPSANGDAPLCRALELTCETLSQWTSKHQSTLPPQVVNITDGSVTDGEPLAASEKVKAISTAEGGTVLWHCQLSSSGLKPQLFPAERDARDARSSTLLRSASYLPKASIRDIMLEFPEVSRIEESRTCVLQADLPLLVRFLACVTRLPLP